MSIRSSIAVASLFAFTTTAGCKQAAAPTPTPTPAASGSATTATKGSAALPAATPSAAPSVAAALVGKAAPDFTLPDLAGAPVTLASFKGKTVVLEWFNPGCPFVVYAHGDGPLKAQPAKATGDGVVWLAINSGAPGKQGAGVERNKAALTEYNLAHPVLLDESGAVGKLYKATNTPGMYVVDAKGTLVYAGAIDNAPKGTPPEEGLRNYVADALADVAAGKPVRLAETKQYGCSVKYAD